MVTILLAPITISYRQKDYPMNSNTLGQNYVPKLLEVVYFSENSKSTRYFLVTANLVEKVFRHYCKQQVG